MNCYASESWQAVFCNKKCISCLFGIKSVLECLGCIGKLIEELSGPRLKACRGVLKMLTQGVIIFSTSGDNSE